MSLVNNPFISVIIPVYNLENYILFAIKSILAQNYLPLEMIIIDDGSTDPTAAKVLNAHIPHLKYFKQPHLGAAQARNLGIEKAQGELIAFLDADDIWMPGKLLAQVDLFRNDPNLDMAFTHIQEFVSPELICPQPPQNRILPGHCTSCLLIKRQSLLKVGIFNPARQVGEFLEWYLKAKCLHLKEAMLDTILVMRRIHQTNTSKLKQDCRHDYLKILHAHMTRENHEDALHLAQ
jgi:glycosyltransferase involved in cell wall biosynthesis